MRLICVFFFKVYPAERLSGLTMAQLSSYVLYILRIAVWHPFLVFKRIQQALLSKCIDACLLFRSPLLPLTRGWGGGG